MGWFDNLFGGVTRFFQKEEKPQLPNHGVNWNSPNGAKNPYSAITALSAYGGHGYTHAAVLRSSQDLAALPIKLFKGKGTKAELIEDSPFLNLINNPSTNVDPFLLREQLAVDLLLSGNCFLLKIGLTEQPTSIIRLHPEEVKIQTDPALGVSGYLHTSGGKTVLYPVDRVIHVRGASYATGPEGLYGTGIVQPLNSEISADLAAAKLASNSAKKGRPDILLSPKDESDIWGAERRKRILNQYNELTENGGALVLSGQVDCTPINQSLREMEFTNIRTISRESISAVSGVVPSILGLPTSNYATAQAQASTYWQNQIIKATRFEYMFTQIAILFDSEYYVKFDYSNVEVLQAKRDAQLSRVEKHIKFGFSPSAAYQYEGLDVPNIAENQNIDDSIEEVEEQSLDFELLKKKYL
jgi:HK97 family phage portal protein